VSRWKSSVTVVEQNPIDQRSVASLRQHDVEMAIIVEIPDAHVCRFFRGVFEQEESRCEMDDLPGALQLFSG
jgi:hypothetical protein